MSEKSTTDKVAQDAERRLDSLFAEAFPTNHPAMHDYALLKMELKRLRSHQSSDEHQRWAVTGQAWILYFEDTAVPQEIFTGYGAEEAARARYENAKLNWSCHLFATVEEWRPSSDAATERPTCGGDGKMTDTPGTFRACTTCAGCGRVVPASRPSASSARDETGWLIEHNTNGMILWWTGGNSPWLSFDDPRWTRDAYQAARFFSPKAAQRAITLWPEWFQKEVKVTDHRFIASTPYVGVKP